MVKKSIKKDAYHFTGWVAHAGGKIYIDAQKSQQKKNSIKQNLINYAGSRFFKVLETGKLRPPKAKERCAAQQIELLAGDDKVIWLTVDPTFGFAKSKEAWSFGFIYDPEILIKKYGGCVRENDFVNDYADILRKVIKKHKWDKGRLPNKPDSVFATFKSLPSTVRKPCLTVFKKEAKKFRTDNELKGDAAMKRLTAKRPPYEIVVRKPLPLNEAKAFILRGSIVKREDFNSH